MQAIQDALRIGVADRSRKNVRLFGAVIKILFDKSSTERRIQTLAREFKYSGHSWGKTKNYAEVPVFLDSKASRLIQLADLVAYALYRFHEYQDDSFYDVIKDCFDREGPSEHGLYVRN